MGMFRYKFKLGAPQGGSLFGHGFGSNSPGGVYSMNMAPYFDFYNGATFLFRVSGLFFATGTKNGAPCLGFTVDTSQAGSLITWVDDETFPANLDRLRVFRDSDDFEYGGDLTPDVADFAGTTLLTSNGADEDGAVNIFKSFLGTAATLTQEGSLLADDVLVAEWSGNFTHVKVVNPYVPWRTGSFSASSPFIVQDQAAGGAAKIAEETLASHGSVFTATDYSQYLADNPGIVYFREEAVERIHAVEQLNDFNDPVTNRIQFTDTWDQGQIVLLQNEPSFYYDPEGAAGSGRSRQDSANALGALADNTAVLVLANSVVGSQTFANDAVLTVQNGVVGSGGLSNAVIADGGNFEIVLPAGVYSVSSSNATIQAWLAQFTATEVGEADPLVSNNIKANLIAQDQPYLVRFEALDVNGSLASLTRMITVKTAVAAQIGRGGNAGVYRPDGSGWSLDGE